MTVEAADRPERPALVILAAGQSTRFGRPKQLEPVGPGGGSLLEYAVYDAVRAGFGRFVLVVRESQRDEFETRLAPVRAAGISLSFARQRLADADLVPLPPPGRVRPWGTGFAVLSAATSLSRRAPFAVCNADDFYGRIAYEGLAHALAAPPPGIRAFAVTYSLADTLSAFGGVSRGLCEEGPDGTLLRMTEGLDLRLDGGAQRTGGGADAAVVRPDVVGCTPSGAAIRVGADSQACMGLWGFFPDILPLLEERFRDFVAASPGTEDEFYLSETVSNLVVAERTRCGLVPAGKGWKGVTFPGDHEGVAVWLRQLTEAGAYPVDLWTPYAHAKPVRSAQASLFGPPQALPSGVATAPGRINLIGEHIDYNGLPVLPMALDRHVNVDFEAVAHSTVELEGDSDHGSFAFRLERATESAPQGHWSNYVRAAARGLLDHGVELKRGIRGTVTGTVPVAEGLSSSSALVVASALALLHANEEQVEALELAALLARAERHVGLQGGGMDQAASLCGKEGHALRIDFEPLRVTPAPVPEGWRWIVASSLTRAEKAGAVRELYNERRAQCAEALERVGRTSWLEVMEADQAEFATVLAGARKSLPLTLSRRFRHVATEGRRVIEAERALRDGEMASFGRLMNESHASLRDDFGVSTPALDEIVGVARDAGAAGARLTGAGFGGCAVALCGANEAKAVIEALIDRFYAPRGGVGRRALFVADASDGATVTSEGGVTCSD
ncbi:MAG: galactokinase [Gemmatimonadota bacterium]|uniref:galactokinase n=1 Tax=Candidatus Palauibacter scopulicola TaxID=3056741 RepID=UPI00238F2596|nr:galactokinase [Candidatus Palauibacter scopulicola]MDE2661648.1 galactokinase [Candidatus Palauibacter scopulicola]